MLSLALAGCATGATASPPAPSPPTQSPSVTNPGAPSPGDAEIGCDLGGHDDAFHIHSLLVVEVDGQRYAPPANIGIGESCMSWVHTHETDGIIHVEAPANVSPTFGDFLDLWAETYPDDPLLAEALAAIAAGEVTVNDEPYAGDALDLVLEDRMRIIVGG